MLILNLKTFNESTGENLENLIAEIREFSSESNLYISPEMIELMSIKKTFPNFQIISQNVDQSVQGESTGWTPAESLIENGIEFSLYNHSEHRVWDDQIIEKIKNLQSKGLKLIVCCQDISEAQKLLSANPYAIAYEPPDLIGSGISVTTRPEVVKEFVDIVGDKCIRIIGAGVSTAEDIKTALSLGAQGVLLASAFVKAENHSVKLQELLQGFKS